MFMIDIKNNQQIINRLLLLNVFYVHNLLNSIFNSLIVIESKLSYYFCIFAPDKEIWKIRNIL